MGWIPSYKKPAGGGGGYVPCSWSTGTVEQIIDALQRHYARRIDLHDYWSVGDERTVTGFSSPFSESSPTESVTFVLSEVGGKYLSDGITECAFQVDFKDCLYGNVQHYTTRTNSGSWKNSLIRTTCNDALRTTMNGYLPGVFKAFINYTGTGNGSAVINDTIDYFALRSEVEMFGTTSQTIVGEGSYIEYYKTSSNLNKYIWTNNTTRKRLSQASTSHFWLRSPSKSDNTMMCGIGSSLSIVTSGGNSNYAVSPFFCI